MGWKIPSLGIDNTVIASNSLSDAAFGIGVRWKFAGDAKKTEEVKEARENPKQDAVSTDGQTLTREVLQVYSTDELKALATQLGIEKFGKTRESVIQSIIQQSN